jgi:hypothetical protein
MDIKEREKQYRVQNKERISEYKKRWRVANKDKIKEIDRRSKEKHKAARYEKAKVWKKKNPDKVKRLNRRTHLKRKYGITEEQYNLMLESQNLCCALCEKHQQELIRPLGVDHNHATGKVRGLLCHECNAAIGLVKEDINLLFKIIDYLKRYNIT